MTKAQASRSNTGNGATLGFERELWSADDALRGSMDAAEYKHVALGLIFLKYISDAFEAYHAQLERERDQGADPEDPDEHRAKGIFWAPAEARWARLQAQAWQPSIGQVINEAMTAIERDNPALKGVLPRDYARPALDKQRLGQLIDLMSNLRVGDEAAREKDILDRVYEYFMSQFASAEGKKGSEFHADLVDCMVALPGQLFYSTQIPACLGFLRREKGEKRRGQVIFIDARKLGRMVDRTHRELTDDDIQKIADAYHVWRGEPHAGAYRDAPGFCRSVGVDEIRKHGYVLTPGRYVGAGAQEDDGETFAETMARLVAELCMQQAEAARLDEAIWKNLKELGYAP